MSDFLHGKELDSYLKDMMRYNRVRKINEFNKTIKKGGGQLEPTLMDYEKLEENMKAKIEKTYFIPREIAEKEDTDTNSKVENNNKLPIISIDTISDVILSEYDNTIDTLIELVSNMKTKVESGSKRYDQLTCLLYSLYILEDKK